MAKKPAPKNKPSRGRSKKTGNPDLRGAIEKYDEVANLKPGLFERVDVVSVSIGVIVVILLIASFIMLGRVE